MVLKNREEKKMKLDRRGGDNPAHKVFSVYVLFCFVMIKGERG